MKIALQLPGFPSIPNPPGLKPGFIDIGSVLTPFLEIAFLAAAFLAFYWLVWGAAAYIMAQGNKENLAKARARITWAIIGFIVVIMAYFIAGFVSEIFTPKGGVPFEKFQN